MRSLFILALLVFYLPGFSQSSLKIVVHSEGTKQAMAGASISIPSLKAAGATDSSGTYTFKNLPSGSFDIVVTYIGYKPLRRSVTLPLTNSLEIELDEVSDEDSPDIIVSATRIDRSIKNTPTRVEVIAGGEISENISMRPGEIRMLLNETTGIITQQTSAVSSTADLRIQELDGRYTQILRDGFPLYQGLSEGLSLVQIPPLDLKQVEIIKGSSSTLYGGGAIAGLVNLVSKTPADKSEISFLANGTSTHGLDLSAFYSQKFGKIGITFFTSRNSSAAYDPFGTGLSAIPKFQRYTVVPRLFFYGKNTDINLGISLTDENRLGGSMDYINHGQPGYYEQNSSDRFTSAFGITHRLGDRSSLNFKNSYNHFNRRLTLPSYPFKGLQQSSFSEFCWTKETNVSSWVAGINLYTDNFSEAFPTTVPARNYSHTTLGAFLQNTWSPVSWVSAETGLRGDYTKPYGFLPLPRISFLVHISEDLTSRIGGGLGYTIPTIFTEESEERHYNDILPVDIRHTSYERSAGANMDITYHARLDELKITINPLLFYTRISHPMVLETLANGKSQYVNATGFTDSKGLDLSMRLVLDHFSFYTGYSYTIAQNHFSGITAWYPLAPHDRLHFDLVYEAEGNIRVALESYYTGPQLLRDSTIGKPYWLVGALVEKTWKHLSIFINGEDLNNVHQSQWGLVYSGTLQNPEFKDVYAPLEGRSINAGIKVRF